MLGLHSRLVLDENVIEPQIRRIADLSTRNLYSVMGQARDNTRLGLRFWNRTVRRASWPFLESPRGGLDSSVDTIDRGLDVGGPSERAYRRIGSRVVAFDNSTGTISHLMIDVSVTTESSVDTDSIADGFQEHASWLESDGNCGCVTYLTGEIIVIESVLDGLFVSQLESTVLSLIASSF